MIPGWLRRLFRLGGPPAARARQEFLSRRAELEQAFFAAAAGGGKPRGLRWKSCEWAAGVELVREKPTGRLAALVGVTIAFEAVEGGDMEDLPAVGNLRNASAAFFYHQGAWHTTGKAIFNLNPDEVVAHFAGQYERVGKGEPGPRPTRGKGHRSRNDLRPPVAHAPGSPVVTRR